MPPRTRDFVFTLNNYSDADVERLKGLRCRYIVFGFETAPTTGTPHLQGYIVFKDGKTYASVKRLIGNSCWVASREGTVSQAQEYCKKGGAFYEKGEPPKQGKRCDLDQVVAAVKAKKSMKEIAMLHSKTYVRMYRGIEALKAKLTENEDCAEVKGIWIWGKPGVGKSEGARLKFGDSLYQKSQNKWFDGYEGEKYIMLDDLDENGKCLSHHLKIWADKYACSGEIKCGTVKLQHEKFIVTSNYSIADLFPEENLREALERRFKVIYVAERNEVRGFIPELNDI